MTAYNKARNVLMGDIITPDPRDLCQQYPLIFSSLCILLHCLPHLVHKLYFDLNSGSGLDVLTCTSLHPKIKAFQLQRTTISTSTETK